MSGRAGLSAEDLLRLRWPIEPALGPRGRLAYVESGLDARHDRLDRRVVLTTVAGGERAAVRWSHPTRRPRWSPEPAADRLGLLADDGAGRWRLALGTTDGAVSILPTADGPVVDFGWSSDGGQLAVATASAITLIDPDTGRTRELGATAPATVGPMWSPTAPVIAYAADRDLCVLEPGRLSRPILRSGLAWRALAWSPDGRWLAALGTASAMPPWSNQELLAVEIETGWVRSLGAELDRSIGQVVRGDDERGLLGPSLGWSADGSAVYALVADGGRCALRAFGLDGSVRVVAADHPAVLEFAVVDDVVVTTWSDETNPGEVSVRAPEGGERVLTELSASWCDTGARRAATPVRAGDVEGWLTLPASAAPAPLVVQLHGGPHYPIGERFSFDAQRWAAAGFAVLRLNPRGSQGYGTVFAAAIAGDWGGADVDDVETLVAAVVLTPAIDPDRIAVVGESYGGFLALCLGARTPRYAAVVAENAVCDLPAMLATNQSVWRDELGLGRPGAIERAAARSPLTVAAGLDQPVLLVRAECDTVVDPAQSLRMASALRAAGHEEVEEFLVPDADHFVNVWGRPSCRLARIAAIDGFLARHLGVEAGCRGREVTA